MTFKLANMVDVVQLVRASDCGSECRGFESHLPPKINPARFISCRVSCFYYPSSLFQESISGDALFLSGRHLRFITLSFVSSPKSSRWGKPHERHVSPADIPKSDRLCQDTGSRRLSGNSCSQKHSQGEKAEAHTLQVPPYDIHHR